MSWDETVLRGTLEEGSYAFYYFDRGKLTGVLAVGRPSKERSPMQDLVEARPAHDEVVDSLRDETVDLETLLGREKATDEAVVGPALSFQEDIRPLFREKDVEEMIEVSDLDLSDYEQVRDQAEGIYARLEDGSMPCDGPWPDERIAKFRSWIDRGMKR